MINETEFLSYLNKYNQDQNVIQKDCQLDGLIKNNLSDKITLGLSGSTLLSQILINYSEYSMDIKIWIKNNILKEFDSDFILGYFITALSCSIRYKEKITTEKIIKSIKELNLAKEIKYNYENNSFSIDDMVIAVYNANLLFETSENLCHQSVLEFIKLSYAFRPGLEGVVALLKDRYGNEYYHSFLQEEKFVIDPAKNIRMNVDDYYDVFKPEVILKMNAKNIIEETSKYENDKYNALLILAVNEQIKKQKS